ASPPAATSAASPWATARSSAAEPAGPPRRSALDLGDDGVGGPLPGVEPLLQRLGVLLHLVGVAEADDHVGHAELLEPAAAVRGVGVERDHVDLAPLLLPPALAPP